MQGRPQGLQEFDIQKKLGQGAFSCVYKVLRKSDGQEYAMKKVRMNGLSAKEKQNALNEVRILASVQSPYIVGYKEAFFDQQENSLFIILEYIAGGDLQSKINYVRKKGQGFYFDEAIIWTYLIHMLKGLNALHKNNIFHRDIKCANLFLSKDHKHLKLGDLNVAKVAKPDAFAQTQAGTPYYASPEVWKDQPYDGRCDVWSIGCVIYEMTALRPPFLAKDLESLCKKVNRGVYESINNRYSKELATVISKCLQVNPKNRMTSEQLLMSEEIQSRLFYDTQMNLNNYRMDLLNTIIVPKNLRDLKNRLPKANYHTEVSQRNLSFTEETSQPDLPKGGVTPVIKRGEDNSNRLQRPNYSALRRTSSQKIRRVLLNENPIQNLYQMQHHQKSSSPRYKRSDSQNSQVGSDQKVNNQRKILNKVILGQVPPLDQPKASFLVLPPLTSNKNLSCHVENEIYPRKVIKKPSLGQQERVMSDKTNIQTPIINKLLKKGVIVESNQHGSPKFKLMGQ